MIINGQERNYIIHDEHNIKGMFGEYRWLSNFHQCTVYFEGLCFNSSEAAYMSAKTENIVIRRQISLMNPKEAKVFCRTIELRDGWEEMKYDVMSAVVFDKFYRNKYIRQLLIDTGDKYIEETNHWNDVFYGVCNGKGQNNLGKILMGIRSFWKLKYSAETEIKPETIQGKLF